MINLYKLFKYTFRDIRNKDKKLINGIWIFTGLYGQGKTLSMSVEAYKLSEKGYKIYSNYGLSFQSGTILSWKDITQVPPNSAICLDELSNLINSRDWKNMPSEFFSLLTQNRKLNIRIMATAQVFDDVDKQFRSLTKYIIKCRKFGRLLTNRYYDQQGYNHSEDKKHNLFVEHYVIEDFMYNLYDTNEMIKKLKTLDDYKKTKKIS